MRVQIFILSQLEVGHCLGQIQPFFDKFPEITDFVSPIISWGDSYRAIEEFKADSWQLWIDLNLV